MNKLLMFRSLAWISFTLTLTACAGLKDVDNRWCPPDQVQTEKISLSADALFKFDRSGVQDMLPQGRSELDNLASNITNDYVQVEQIHLTGHTDRLGSASYNQRLSEARANTVKTYLQNQGVRAPMTTEGRGKTQPVTQRCTGSGQALIDCLQPDRRVDVEINGLRKSSSN